MAVAHSSTVQLAGTAAGSTQSITVADGDTVVVKTATRGTGVTVTSVVWDQPTANEPFTLQDTDINNDARSSLWVLPADESTNKTANVLVSYSGSNRNVVGYSIYTGCDTITPVRTGTVQTNNGNSAAPTVSVTGVSGDIIVDSLSQVSSGPDSATADHTERHNTAATGGGSDTRGASQELAATGGSDAMGWSMGGSDSWAVVACALREPFTPPAGWGVLLSNKRHRLIYE